MSLNRRAVLAGAAGAACLCAFKNPDPAAVAVKSRRWIDFHHHILPPFYLEEAGDVMRAQGGGRILPQAAAWTPEASIRAMDAEGIETSVLSISTPGIWFGDSARAASLARRCNEYAADLARHHPRRFGLFAALPLPNVEASLREIDHSFGTLGADGVGLMTSYGDIWPGDPRLAPVLEELNRRRAIVYLHPTAPGCCRNLMPGVVPPMLEFVFDTTRAVVSLLLSGSLDRYKNIRFIFSHAGGTLPMLAGRIEEVARQTRPDVGNVAPGGIRPLLQRLHFDLANSLNPSAWAATRAFMPLTQLLLGTDFPFQPAGAPAAGFESLRLTKAEQRQIGRVNALKLLPRLA